MAGAREVQLVTLRDLRGWCFGGLDDEACVNEASAGRGIRKWTSSKSRQKNRSPITSRAVLEKPRKERMPGSWSENEVNLSRKLSQFPVGFSTGEPREIPPKNDTKTSNAHPFFNF